jgi:hypothetical protein
VPLEASAQEAYADNKNLEVSILQRYDILRQYPCALITYGLTAFRSVDKPLTSRRDGATLKLRKDLLLDSTAGVPVLSNAGRG